MNPAQWVLSTESPSNRELEFADIFCAGAVMLWRRRRGTFEPGLLRRCKRVEGTKRAAPIVLALGHQGVGAGSGSEEAEWAPSQFVSWWCVAWRCRC